MLPYDYSRCRPDIADHHCRNCQRWADHPDQTWGERTPQHQCGGSVDENCRFIPIDREDGK